MEVPAKRMKITADIWDYVLDYITEHPEMATGKFTGPAGKQRLAELWNDLTEKLNALGGGMKTASKWQKSFSDWKYNVKQKYAEIKTQRSKTGGGTVFQKNLTVQEERLLGLIGMSFLEGDAVVEEIGLPRQEATETIIIEAGPSTSFEPSLSDLPGTASPIAEETTLTSPSTSRPSSRTTDVPITQPFMSGSSHREAVTLERFQHETMEVLSDINQNLHSMAQNLDRLTNAIIEYINRN